MAAMKKNQRALTAALEADLHANPVRFFETVIMPLLPRKTSPFETATVYFFPSNSRATSPARLSSLASSSVPVMSRMVNQFMMKA